MGKRDEKNILRVLIEKYPKEVLEYLMEWKIGWSSQGRRIEHCGKGDEKQKVVGPNWVPVEAWKNLEDVSIRWLKDLLNKVL